MLYLVIQLFIKKSVFSEGNISYLGGEAGGAEELKEKIPPP